MYNLENGEPENYSFTMKKLLECLNGGFGIYELINGKAVPLYLSKGFYEMSGWESGDYSQFKDDAMAGIIEKDREIFRRNVVNAVKSGKPFELGYRALRGDGTIRTNLIRATRLENFAQTENPVYMAFIFDVSGVAELNEQYSSVISNIDGGACIFEFVGKNIKPLYVNDCFLKLFGYTRQSFEANNCNVLENIASDDIKKMFTLVKLSKVSGKGFAMDFKRVDRNGGVNYYNLRAKPYPYSKSKNQVFITLITNITERRQMEEQLCQRAESTERQYKFLNQLYETVPCGIVQFSDNVLPIPLNFNRAAWQIFGYDNAEEFSEIFCSQHHKFIFNEDLPLFYEAFRNVKETGIKQSFEYRINRRDNTVGWIKGTLEKMLNIDNVPVLQNVFMDVTDLKEKTERLAVSEAAYRITSENNDRYIARYDIASKTVFHSGRMAEFFALPQTVENMPESIIDVGIVAEESKNNFRSLFKDIEKGNKSGKTKIHIKRADGKWLWMELSFFTMYDENNSAKGTICALADISENVELQNQLEIALRNSYDEVYEFNTAGDYFYQLTSTGNGIAKRIMPQKFTQCINFVAEKAVHKDFRQNFLDILDTKNLEMKLNSAEDRIFFEILSTGTNDGVYKWRSYLITKANWAEHSFLMFIRDIDKQKKESIRYEKINEICKFAVENQYDDVYILNPLTGQFWMYYADGKIADFSEMDEYDKIVENFRKNIFPEDIPHWESAMTRNSIAARLKTEKSVSLRYRTLIEGEPVWTEALYTYFERNNDLVLVTTRNVNSEVLAAIEAEEKLKDALHRAKAASTAKSKFLAGISHDIRTPMNAIIGMTELTKMHADKPETVRDGLEEIDSSSKYMLSLLDDILDLSRIEKGKFRLNPAAFDLSKLCSEIKSIVQLQAADNGLKFTLCIDDNMNKYFVGDRLRIKQILMNLLSNSVKYTAEGGKIALKVSETAVSTTSAVVVFMVIDTGKGISSKLMKHIFEPFEKDGESMSCGVGLSIVHNLTELMNGTITVHSKEETGTVFEVRIPLAVTNEAGLNSGFEISDEENSFDGKRILLVEDNEINREVAAALLRSKGFRVDTAINGQVCLKRFMTAKDDYYSAILMDIRMPVMDGLEAARRIRVSGKNNAETQPIIALTANAFDEDIDATRKAGMNAHITKPIQPKELIRVLKKYV